jgi:hypothetical protein
MMSVVCCECQLWRVKFMLIVANNAECHHPGCRYAECRYANCDGTSMAPSSSWTCTIKHFTALIKSVL